MSDPHHAVLAAVRENLRAGRALNHGIPPGDWNALLDQFSRFVDRRDADGFIVDSDVVIGALQTPRPCLHLLASTRTSRSETWGSFWDPCGGGFSCVGSVLAGRMTSHLDTNYVPTAPQPQDVRRFFLHEAGQAWPMFPVPGHEDTAYDAYECVQGVDRFSLHAVRDGLTCDLGVIVHPDRPLEVWSVTIRNDSDRPRTFSWFTSLRVNIDSFPAYYFVPRVVCEGVVEGDALVFLNHDKNNRNPRQAFFATAPRFDRFDMMGEAFDGIGGRSTIPAAVRAGRCTNSLGLQPYAGLVAAVQFDANLAPGQSRRWVCAYGVCPYDEPERKRHFDDIRTNILAQPDACAAAVRDGWTDRVRALMARTPDPAIDQYFNVWSKIQARSQARFCRALDKIGFRDVLQDLLGVCECEPDCVRANLLHTLRYQSADGRAVRQYEAVPGAGNDMRMYMDCASWIPDTLVHYLKESGDFSILDEPVPFFDMDRRQPDEANTGTVYDHALRAVRSLATSTGYHGLCRIGYGDWNDALSGIGGEQGVSIWLSCACVYAAQKMAELANRLDRPDEANEMASIAHDMTTRINEHAWDGDWYVYAINGEGQPIGSRQNPEGQIHLNVNTWALFTGVAKAADREAATWKAIERLDTPLGHRLLAPSYTAKSRAGVGRIADQKPGMFENGSIYTHGEAFYLYALIANRRSDECRERLLRTLPSQQVQALTTALRHQQSNFTVGPDHPNYGMQLFSNFTGSVAWYRRVIEWMLGLRADFDALRIDPRPPAAWDEYTVHKLWRGRSIHARFRRTDRPDLTVTLNGRPAHATIPLGDLSPEGVNEIIVEFGRGR